MTDKEGFISPYVLSRTPRASYIESVDGYGIVFLFGSLLARVELSTFVDVFATCCAFHGEWSHEADSLDFGTCLLWSPRTGDFRWIEIRWIILQRSWSQYYFFQRDTRNNLELGSEFVRKKLF
jgi:hypothetical protein